MTQVSGTIPPFIQSIGNPSQQKRNIIQSHSTSTTRQDFFIREPLGKRSANKDMDDECAPRIKRRFEKVSACLEQFSISKDNEVEVNMESSDSDDESTSDAACSSEKQPTVIIEEPEDDPKGKILLDDKLQKFLGKMRQNNDFLLPRLNRIRGDEVTLWRPTILTNPFDDPSMAGRIQEVKEGEELGLMKDDCDAMFVEESGSESQMSTASNSPFSSPLRIVEVTDTASEAGSPLSINTEETMDFD